MEMIDEYLLQEGYIKDQLQQQLELVENWETPNIKAGNIHNLPLIFLL
ncbi:MAG: hypothetical protein VX677_08940 [Candidatus Poribacteria bacterium]|nr:hypothetical protein [Candidatus Poribacteria bacterium]